MVCVYLVHFRSNATVKWIFGNVIFYFIPEIQHVPYTLFDIAKKIEYWFLMCDFQCSKVNDNLLLIL